MLLQWYTLNTKSLKVKGSNMTVRVYLYLLTERADIKPRLLRDQERHFKMVMG